MNSASDSAGPQTAAKGAGYSLALLLGINLFNYIDRYILASTEEDIRRAFFHEGDPDAKFWTGTLATAFLISYMVTAPIFGWLADRWRRWVIIALGVGVWSLASGATGMAQGFTVLLLTRVFVGIGEGAYGPAAPPLISDLYPISQRGRKLSWFYMAMPVGTAIGYSMGAKIAHDLGWRWAFYLVVPPGLILAGLCLLMREPARGRTDGNTALVKRRFTAADCLVLFRTRSFLLNVIGMTLMTFAIGGVSFWMPTYISEFRHQPGNGKVLFGAIALGAGLFATLAGGWLGDKLRARWSGSYFLVAGIGILIAFPFSIAMLWAPFPAAWVLMFAAMFFLFLGIGPQNTILINVTHPAMRSTAFAITILIIHILGDAISPPLIGWITGHAGGDMNIGFLVVSAAMLGAGIAWCLGARHLQRDTELAATRLKPDEPPATPPTAILPAQPPPQNRE